MMSLKKVALFLSFLLVTVFIFALSGVRSVDAGRGESGGSEPTPTPEEEAPDASSENLLVNPDFSAEFSGWQSVNGYWLIHPTSCDPSIWPQEMAEMDQDSNKDGTPRGWLVGQEDWLWQDVAAPGAHDQVTFTIYESHHMREGVAETRLYGSEDSVTWTEVWHRPQPEASAYGAGKACEPVPGFTYEIPVSHSYSYYRLEFHGKMVDAEDGWIFSWLSLEVNEVSSATATPESDEEEPRPSEATATATPEVSPTPTSELDSPSDKSDPATPTVTVTATSTQTPEPTATSEPTVTPEPTVSCTRGCGDASTPTPTPTPKVRVG